MKTTMLIALSFLALATLTHGHGRLRVPPGRSTLWRDGLHTDSQQINYNDNQLFCGGVGVQYDQNGGKCGLCGDPWNQATPRDHEQGGRFGNGIIVGTYLEGQQMDIGVQLTAHHKGWFEFKLCPSAPATQACFDANLLALTAPVNGMTRYAIPQYGAGWYNVTVQLPAGVSCTQCVLQWRYHTGNSWGVDPDGTGCVGCGNQEEFYGCADIAITASGGAGVTSTTTDATSTTTDATRTTTTDANTDADSSTTASTTTTTTSSSAKGDNCKATGAFKGDANMDKWCVDNCNHVPRNCPSSHCVCSTATTPTPTTTSTTTAPTSTTTTTTLSTTTTPTSAPVCMKSIAFDTEDEFTIEYCTTQCPGCKDTLCRCADHLNCRGIGEFNGLDAYCTQQCREGNCPAKHCICD